MIATYGETACDVFYVKDLFGHKVSHKAKLASIEASLLTAMGGGGVRAQRQVRTAAPHEADDGR